MQVALLVLTIFTITATVLPLSRQDAWWIRGLDFPRAQIVVLTAFVFVSQWWWRKEAGSMANLLLAALILCLLYQAYMMYPYLPFAPQQVQPSRNSRRDSSLSLMTANVLMENRNAAQLTSIIREADPDIILTVETDEWWQVQLAEFEHTHPFIVSQPQDNTYGMLLYSRLELVNAEVKFLIQDDIPSIHATVRLTSGLEVALRCLHPRPPFPTEDESTTDRDAELLLVGKEIKKKTEPVIVMGDLNDVAWSRTNYLFQNISGLLDPRIGRGFFNTFHAEYFFLRFPLDHFFHSNHFRLLDFRRLAYFGSDHFPVFIALSYEPDAVHRQEELQADGADQQEADEKIEKALVA